MHPPSVLLLIKSWAEAGVAQPSAMRIPAIRPTPEIAAPTRPPLVSARAVQPRFMPRRRCARRRTARSRRRCGLAQTLGDPAAGARASICRGMRFHGRPLKYPAPVQTLRAAPFLDSRTLKRTHETGEMSAAGRPSPPLKIDPDRNTHGLIATHVNIRAIRVNLHKILTVRKPPKCSTCLKLTRQIESKNQPTHRIAERRATPTARNSRQLSQENALILVRDFIDTSQL